MKHTHIHTHTLFLSPFLSAQRKYILQSLCQLLCVIRKSIIQSSWINLRPLSISFFIEIDSKKKIYEISYLPPFIRDRVGTYLHVCFGFSKSDLGFIKLNFSDPLGLDLVLKFLVTERLKLEVSALTRFSLSPSISSISFLSTIEGKLHRFDSDSLVSKKISSKGSLFSFKAIDCEKKINPLSFHTNQTRGKFLASLFYSISDLH